MERLRQEYPRRACAGWAEALTDAAILVFPNERAGGATPDPGDEKVLECALAAEADVIVTGDKRHLLPLRRFRDVDIVSPSDFLRRLQL
jgi:predicted nucleic acid-binding protein